MMAFAPAHRGRSCGWWVASELVVWGKFSCAPSSNSSHQMDTAFAHVFLNSTLRGFYTGCFLTGPFPVLTGNLSGKVCGGAGIAAVEKEPLQDSWELFKGASPWVVSLYKSRMAQE